MKTQMPRTLNEIIVALPESERAKIEARAQELIAQERSLQDHLRIEAALEDRSNAAAIRAFQKNPSETVPDAVLAAILDGSHPIKAFRDHRGMTQAQLAKASGTSSVYISRIERSRRRAGRKLRLKLAKALGVPPDLLNRSED